MTLVRENIASPDGPDNKKNNSGDNRAEEARKFKEPTGENVASPDGPDIAENNNGDNKAEEARILTISAEIVLDDLEARMVEHNNMLRSDLEEAEQYIERAVSLSSQSELQRGLVEKQSARLLLFRGEIDEASRKVLSSYDNILKAFEDLDHEDHHIVADVTVLKSDVHRKRQMFCESRESLEKARDTYRSKFGDNHPKVAETLLRFSLLSFEMNEKQDAEQYYNQSKTICDAIKVALAEQTAAYKFEGSACYKPETTFPLFIFQEDVRKKLNLRKKEHGVYWS